MAASVGGPSLSPVLSPTANVRRTCLAVVQEGEGEEDGQCLVRIQDEPLQTLAGSLVTELSSKAVEWDAEGWHYNAEGYRRPAQQAAAVEAMKTERIALYILALDAINFCFWPSTAETKTNRLEYQHLAIALQRVAQQDDRLAAEKEASTCENWRVDDEDSRIVRAESSFALAPSNLAELAVDELQSWMERYLPRPPQEEEDEEEYVLPNIQERVRLLQEVGAGLLRDHRGSATALLKSSRQSADGLVHSLLQSFPGFRDAACRSGRPVYFYKRAQIAVADLWSALCYSRPSPPDHHHDGFCHFHDIDKLTTFADYRVPQLLRHVGVLEYHPQLAAKVDARQTLGHAGCPEEVAIRAATIVAVDRLVQQCSSLICQSPRETNVLCAVTLDWYLWQWGERLDRHGTVGNFHRVETIYY